MQLRPACPLCMLLSSLTLAVCPGCASFCVSLTVLCGVPNYTGLAAGERLVHLALVMYPALPRASHLLLSQFSSHAHAGRTRAHRLRPCAPHTHKALTLPEQQAPLHGHATHYSTAFTYRNTAIMFGLCCPPSSCALACAIHDSCLGFLRHSLGAAGEWCMVCGCVKQGCVARPCL